MLKEAVVWRENMTDEWQGLFFYVYFSCQNVARRHFL